MLFRRIFKYLRELLDVNISSPTNGQALIYDTSTSKWKNATVAADNTKADKVSGAVSGNFAGLDASGNLTDSGSDASDFASSSALSTHIAATSAHGVSGAIVGTTDAQTLTNKTIAAGSNTISGLANSNIATGAAIDASKVHDGTVSNTEFGYLSGVTGALQTQLDNKINGAGTVTDGALVLFSGTSGTQVIEGAYIDLYARTDLNNVFATSQTVNTTTALALTLSGSDPLGVSLTWDHDGNSAYIANTDGTLTASTSSFRVYSTVTGTSGAATPALYVTPTVNQSGTAGYTGLLVNVTESATGSGNRNLIDLQVATSSKFRVNSAGDIYATGYTAFGTGQIYCNLIAAATYDTSGGNSNQTITVHSRNRTTAGTQIKLASGTNSATSGTNIGVSIEPAYNQASGTAANTDLLINRTETAVGSGAQNLIDLQVGGSSKFRVSNAGSIVFAGGTLASNGNWFAGYLFSSRIQATATRTDSSGVINIVDIIPTINQSGTAGYIALDINPTHTATGSGTKLLQRWAVGGTEVASLDTSGNVSANNLYGVVQVAGPTTLSGDGATTKTLISFDIPANRTTGRYKFRVWLQRTTATWVSNPTITFRVGSANDSSTYTTSTSTTLVGYYDADIILGSSTQESVYAAYNTGNVRGSLSSTQSSASTITVSVTMIIPNAVDLVVRSVVEYLPQ